MIAAVIRWSAHNVFLIGIATVFAVCFPVMGALITFGVQGGLRVVGGQIGRGQMLRSDGKPF